MIKQSLQHSKLRKKKQQTTALLSRLREKLSLRFSVFPAPSWAALMPARNHLAIASWRLRNPGFTKTWQKQTGFEYGAFFMSLCHYMCFHSCRTGYVGKNPRDVLWTGFCSAILIQLRKMVGKSNLFLANFPSQWVLHMHHPAPKGEKRRSRKSAIIYIVVMLCA